MWETCRISDLGNVVGGATPSTQDPSNYNGEIPWITPKDLSSLNGRYISKGERSISQKGYDSCSTQLVPAGTVLFSSRAPIGYIAIAKNDLCTNQGFKSVVPNEDVDAQFLYYLLLYNADKISSKGSGTTFKEISGSVMRSISVKVPDLTTQRAIANTLSCLDNKIELNNKINANLEAQAQAIFKSWFVDFEPFQDGEFVDSELGPIPKGWKVGSLGDIGTIVGGSTPSKAKEEYYTLSGQGISWITPKDLSINKNKYIYRGEVDITDIGYKNSSTRIMPEGSVLFSSRAPIGYIAIAANELCTNQGFKSVVPNKNIGTEFIYYTLKANLETIQNLGSGSTFKEVSGSVMKNVSILIPSFTSIKEFSDIVSTLTAQQKVLESQSQILVGLRDSLLPKLMSREVEIPEKG